MAVTELSGNQRFRWRERVRLKRDYNRVFRARCSASDGSLVVYVTGNGLDWTRFGLSVSRRVGRAARRNYIRRSLREAFRRNKERWPAGVDIVCVVKNFKSDSSAKQLAALQRLVEKAYQRWTSQESARR